MKVLVTGGAGFIGSHLCERLLGEGHEVSVLDDLSTGSLRNLDAIQDHPKFRLEVGSVRNEPEVSRLVEWSDHVYHLAAAVGVRLIIDRPVETIETNVLGTEVVLKAANRFKKRVLLTSTSEVYGNHTDQPLREEALRTYGPTVVARWAYAGSKAVDEFLALAYFREKKLPVVIVRLFNTVGPRQTGQYGMVIPRFVQAALVGRPIQVYGDGLQTRSFGYVGDVIGGMTALMNHPGTSGEIFNLGNDREISIRDLAALVKEKTRSASPIVFVPYREAYGEGFEDMPRRTPDLSKARRTVGYEPKTQLGEILDRVIRSFEQ